MRAEPGNWQKYYHAEVAGLDLQLQHSLSDRIRYYWPDALIGASQERLFANLRETVPTLPLVSQYLSLAYAAMRAGHASLDPADLVMAHVSATLDAYYGACYPHASHLAGLSRLSDGQTPLSQSSQHGSHYVTLDGPKAARSIRCSRFGSTGRSGSRIIVRRQAPTRPWRSIRLALY